MRFNKIFTLTLTLLLFSSISAGAPQKRFYGFDQDGNACSIEIKGTSSGDQSFSVSSSERSSYFFYDLNNDKDHTCEYSFKEANQIEYYRELEWESSGHYEELILNYADVEKSEIHSFAVTAGADSLFKWSACLKFKRQKNTLLLCEIN